MKVSILQMPVTLGKRINNFDKLHVMIENAMKTTPDVLLLPEMWDIGYYPSPINDFTDTNGEQVRQELSSLASEFHINIVGGSAAIEIDKNIYNTSFVFNRDGQLISSYRKTHLFSPAGENSVFTAGDILPTYQIDGIRCATLICYDIRFPELVRTMALKDIAILFVPAAWPEERIMHWDTLLKARAIENQIFVCAANGIGNATPNFQMGGHSVIIDPWGEILAQANEGIEDGEIINANLQVAIQNQIRASINVFADRRPELYKI